MSFETAIEYFELPGERKLSFLPAVISNTCVYSNSPAILSNDHDHDDDDNDGLPELLVDTFTSDVYSNSPAILSTMAWKGNNSPPF
jgi:hypothetical protein